MPHKPTEAQRRVLEAIGHNRSLLVIVLPEATFYTFGSRHAPKVHGRTFNSVLRRGWIAPLMVSESSTSYELTAAGRAALQQSGVGEEKEAQGE